jgi:Tol biopolymer transport system component
MNPRRLTALILAALVCASPLAPAAQSTDEMLLRTAIELADAKGDVKGAVELLKRLSSSTDPKVAASAKDHLARLAAAAPAPRSDAPVERRILVDASFEATDVSRDGRLAVGMDRAGAIQLRNLTTGAFTVLVPVSSGRLAAWPLLSPDGRSVAYGVIEPSLTTGHRGVSLRVIGTDAGAEPRTLVSLLAVPPVYGLFPQAWSPDGKAILVSRPGGVVGGSQQGASPQLGWISVVDGAFTSIKTLDPGRGPGRPALSHDGRWIAYSGAPPTPGSELDKYIYVLDTSTQTETVVVSMLGNNVEPVWTPDGKHLLFVGDRSGSGLWSVAVKNGRPAGEPTLIRPGIRRGLIEVSESGALHHTRVEGNEFTTFVADRAATGWNVVQVFAGGSPALSPDGKSVAFLRYLTARDGAKARPFELTVRTVETGHERAYPRAGTDRLAPIIWRPEASGVMVSIVSPVEGGGNLLDRAFFGLDLRTNAFTRIVRRDADAHSRSNSAAVSPDGTTMFMAARRDSGAVAGIVAVDATTGAERPVVRFPLPGLAAMQIIAGPDEVGPALALSPDGATLALLTIETPTQARLYAVNVDGSGYRELYGPYTSTPGAPAWTPDGRTIVIGTRDTTGMRALRVPLDGGSPQPFDLDLMRLTGTIPLPSLNRMLGGFISFSRDGSRMAFEATTLRSYELWAIENVGGLQAAGRR